MKLVVIAPVCYHEHGASRPACVTRINQGLPCKYRYFH